MRLPWLALVAVLFGPPSAAAEPVPRIAIIIDDLGYQLEAGRRAIALPGPLSFAILPATPRGRVLAETAHRLGKEVLLHLPLQAIAHHDTAEPGAITLDMSHGVFRVAFATALESVPYAIGVSGHRGSLLTRHPGHMQWLMEEIRSRDGLFFVDSFTTSKSIAMQIATETGVPAAKRDVFLDTDRSPLSLAREFERLKNLAQQQGVAVAIGHPYPETLDFLERELPALAGDGFELIPVSEVLRTIVEPALVGKL
jgi:polysaccharide deacetylase 2 family uncharacterized protein YibQ